MAGYLITSLLSLITNLLPSITASAQAPSSSSSNSNNSERGHARAAEEDLERLMRTLEQIKDTLYDADEREIRDRSVKRWLKELKKVAHDAEDVLSEYQYEVTRVQLEARKASEAEYSCWQLFQHYAFRGTSGTMPPHLVKMGREIMKKCGGLPLAVKSIASLLGHETDEEGWKEILESDLWEMQESKEAIFPALEISYLHLPAHLKPCFKELKERSFLDDSSGRSSECCKLHDIIHDLARLKSCICM